MTSSEYRELTRLQLRATGTICYLTLKQKRRLNELLELKKIEECKN